MTATTAALVGASPDGQFLVPNPYIEPFLGALRQSANITSPYPSQTMPVEEFSNPWSPSSLDGWNGF